MRCKITYTNHIRSGILHGEIVDEKDGHIYLRLFTEEENIVPIDKKSIDSIENLI